MHVLDYVRLIESEILAPPTASTFEPCSITKLSSYGHSDSWNRLYNNSWEYDWKPSLEENRGKMADFFGETTKSRSRVRIRLSGISVLSI